MPKNIRRGDDGKYHINNQTFDELEGTRAKVFHGTAYKTSGGLTKKDLIKNKSGAIVSKKKSMDSKKNNRLLEHGYTAKKGKFGSVKIGAKNKSPRSPKSRKSRRKSKRSKK